MCTNHCLSFSARTGSKLPAGMAPNQHTPEILALCQSSILISLDPSAAFDPVNHHPHVSWCPFPHHSWNDWLSMALTCVLPEGPLISGGTERIHKCFLQTPDLSLLSTPCTCWWCSISTRLLPGLCWWHLTDPFLPTNRLLIIPWLVRQAPHHESQLIV